MDGACILGTPGFRNLDEIPGKLRTEGKICNDFFWMGNYYPWLPLIEGLVARFKLAVLLTLGQKDRVERLIEYNRKKTRKLIRTGSHRQGGLHNSCAHFRTMK